MGLSTVEWAVSVEILNTQIILSEPRSNTLLLSDSNSSPQEVLAVERFKPERKRRGKELFQDSVGDCTLESIHIKAKLNEVKEPIRKGGISIRRDPVVREMLSDALEDKSSFWHSLDDAVRVFPGSWLCLGDFNVVASQLDKHGGNPVTASSSRSVNHLLDGHGMVDLGFSGPLSTWSNKRQGAALIWERLDREVLQMGNGGFCSHGQWFLILRVSLLITARFFWTLGVIVFLDRGHFALNPSGFEISLAERWCLKCGTIRCTVLLPFGYALNSKCFVPNCKSGIDKLLVAFQIR
ncbi:hypothetical protein CJ030_MR2G006032 [Morella rubra]|uniref:Endonuclease/exonuclease/phosphatase domain-containing protein n=1 Tax=Morella rubra TaxID=262757 RepID=A0A6A1WK68_9ROSI|nr:hypothetical protein CJ030_MR2G006032 [Morella rubra]